jgi:GT2 family glycosyltransferase
MTAGNFPADMRRRAAPSLPSSRYLANWANKRRLFMPLDLMEGCTADSLTRRISIIVPTYNRARSLQALLASLAVAEAPLDVGIEVLVVNNGSTDETSLLLAHEAAQPKAGSLKVIDEKLPGKARAINCAMAYATGDVVLVLDDDVIIDRHCIVGHLNAHGETAFDAIQGRVLPGHDLGGRPADLGTVREYNIPYSDHGDEIHEIRGLTGTNMSFKREVFEKVGPFDTRLGPGAAGFSEDSEYSIRIRKAGFKIGYTPHAVAYHELNPARYGRAYNRDVAYRKGISRSLYRDDSIPLRVLPDLLVNCIRYGLYRVVGSRRRAYKAEGRIMKCWGYLMGKLQRRHSSGVTG